MSNQSNTQTKLISLTNFIPPTTNPVEITNLAVPYHVKPRVPYEEIFDALQMTLILLTTDNGYISDPMVKVISELKFLQLFTDLDFSQLDNQVLENRGIYELYDIVTSNNIFETVYSYVAADQATFFFDTLTRTMHSIMEYRNSAAGIVETISLRAKETSKTHEDLMQQLADPANTGLLQQLAQLTTAA